MSEDALPEFYFAHSARCCSLALPCCPVVRETYFLVRPCWTHGRSSVRPDSLFPCIFVKNLRREVFSFVSIFFP